MASVAPCSRNSMANRRVRRDPKTGLRPSIHWKKKTTDEASEKKGKEQIQLGREAVENSFERAGRNLQNALTKKERNKLRRSVLIRLNRFRFGRRIERRVTERLRGRRKKKKSKKATMDGTADARKNWTSRTHRERNVLVSRTERK